MNEIEKFIDDFLSMKGDELDKDSCYVGRIFEIPLQVLLEEFYDYYKENF